MIPYAGVEDLLVNEMPETVKRRFLEKAANRDDYPTECGLLPENASVSDLDKLLRKVLKARKGAFAGYAANLVAEAQNTSELPNSIVNLLLDIDSNLAEPPPSSQTSGKENTESAESEAPQAHSATTTGDSVAAAVQES